MPATLEPPPKRSHRNEKRREKNFDPQAALQEYGYSLESGKMVDHEKNAEAKEYNAAYHYLTQWAYKKGLFVSDDDDGNSYGVWIETGREQKDFADLFTEAAKLTEGLDKPERDAWLIAMAVIRHHQELQYKDQGAYGYAMVAQDLTSEEIEALQKEYVILPRINKALEDVKDLLPSNFVGDHLAKAGCLNEKDIKKFTDLAVLLCHEFNLCNGHEIDKDHIGILGNIMKTHADYSVAEIKGQIKECNLALEKTKNLPDCLKEKLLVSQIGCRNAEEVRRLVECCKAYTDLPGNTLYAEVEKLRSIHNAAQELHGISEQYVAAAINTATNLQNCGNAFDRVLAWKTSADIWQKIAKQYPNLEAWQGLIIQDLIVKTGNEYAQSIKANMDVRYGFLPEFPKPEDFSELLTEDRQTATQHISENVLGKLTAILAQERKPMIVDHMIDDDKKRAWLLSRIPELKAIPNNKAFYDGMTTPALFALAEGKVADAIRLLEEDKTKNQNNSSQRRLCIDFLFFAGDKWKELAPALDPYNTKFNALADKFRAPGKIKQLRKFMAAYPELPCAEIIAIAKNWNELKVEQYVDQKLPYTTALNQAQMRMANEGLDKLKTVENRLASRRNIHPHVTKIPESLHETYDVLPFWKKLIMVSVATKYHKQNPGISSWDTNDIVKEEITKRFEESIGKGQVRALMEDLEDTFANRANIILVLFAKANLSFIESEALARGGIKALAGLKIDDFRKAYKRLTKNHQIEDSWCATSAVGLSTVFGNRMEKWLTSQKKAGRSEHDATEWLPTDTSARNLEGLGDWLLKFADRDVKDLRIVATNWKDLTVEEKKLGFKELVAAAKMKVYPNLRNTQFALEAASWGTPLEEYPKYEDVYLNSQNTPEPFNSVKRWEKNGLVGRFLPRSDPRVGFFGQHTNCCQHLGHKTGRACAVSTMSDPFSQCFVIEKEGKIIAGSWAWEAINALPDHEHPNQKLPYKVACFDNIEALTLTSDQQDSALEIYKEAGQYLADNGCRKVTIGTNLGDVALTGLLPTDGLKLPDKYSGYTDAASQVLLAENEKAIPIEKELPKVWVRGALEEDLKEAESIAKLCYPEGLQTVSIPDDLQNAKGLVLKDEIKGIIGYAVWDEANKEVTDMAVHPDERRYSMKLFNALATHIRQAGGEWSVEARDKTTYQLLKAYEKRGIIEIHEDELSYKHAGDDYRRVRFSAVKQAKENAPDGIDSTETIDLSASRCNQREAAAAQ